MNQKKLIALSLSILLAANSMGISVANAAEIGISSSSATEVNAENSDSETREKLLAVFKTYDEYAASEYYDSENYGSDFAKWHPESIFIITNARTYYTTSYDETTYYMALKGYYAHSYWGEENSELTYVGEYILSSDKTSSKDLPVKITVTDIYSMDDQIKEWNSQLKIKEKYSSWDEFKKSEYYDSSAYKESNEKNYSSSKNLVVNVLENGFKPYEVLITTDEYSYIMSHFNYYYYDGNYVLDHNVTPTEKFPETIYGRTDAFVSGLSDEDLDFLVGKYTITSFLTADEFKASDYYNSSIFSSDYSYAILNDSEVVPLESDINVFAAKKGYINKWNRYFLSSNKTVSKETPSILSKEDMSAMYDADYISNYKILKIFDNYSDYKNSEYYDSSDGSSNNNYYAVVVTNKKTFIYPYYNNKNIESCMEYKLAKYGYAEYGDNFYLVNSDNADDSFPKVISRYYTDANGNKINNYKEIWKNIITWDIANTKIEKVYDTYSEYTASDDYDSSASGDDATDVINYDDSYAVIITNNGLNITNDKATIYMAKKGYFTNKGNSYYSDCKDYYYLSCDIKPTDELPGSLAVEKATELMENDEISKIKIIKTFEFFNQFKDSEYYKNEDGYSNSYHVIVKNDETKITSSGLEYFMAKKGYFYYVSSVSGDKYFYLSCDLTANDETPAKISYTNAEAMYKEYIASDEYKDALIDNYYRGEVGSLYNDAKTYATSAGSIGNLNYYKNYNYFIEYKHVSYSDSGSSSSGTDFTNNYLDYYMAQKGYLAISKEVADYFNISTNDYKYILTTDYEISDKTPKFVSEETAYAWLKADGIKKIAEQNRLTLKSVTDTGYMEKNYNFFDSDKFTLSEELKNYIFENDGYPEYVIETNVGFLPADEFDAQMAKRGYIKFYDYYILGSGLKAKENLPDVISHEDAADFKFDNDELVGKYTDSTVVTTTTTSKPNTATTTTTTTTTITTVESTASTTATEITFETTNSQVTTASTSEITNPQVTTASTTETTNPQVTTASTTETTNPQTKTSTTTTTTTKTKVSLGDLNNDNNIDSKDAVIVLKSYAETLAGKKTSVSTELGDVNGDGKLDSKDAVIILRYYAAKLAGVYNGNIDDFK